MLEHVGFRGTSPHPPRFPSKLAPPPGIGFPNSIRLQAGDADIPKWLQSLSETGALEVLAPLIIGENPVGLLGLGKRWDEEIFDSRDLEIVHLIAQQAGEEP